MTKSDNIKIKKTDLLTALVAITLLVSLGNLYATYNLHGNTGSIDTGTDTQPTKAAPAQPTQPSQPSQPSKVEVSVDDDPVKGSDDALVTIIEFSDFQCPYCARFYSQTLPQINENYIKTGKVKIVFRDFPLGFHDKAQKAGEAAGCADDQGKFWEYHDKLFDTRKLDVPSLKQHAADLGLDTATFDSCLDSGEHVAEIQKDIKDGQSYGVSGTPAFFVNGVKIVGAQPYQVFQQAIETALADKK